MKEEPNRILIQHLYTVQLPSQAQLEEFLLAIDQVQRLVVKRLYKQLDAISAQKGKPIEHAMEDGHWIE